MQVLVAISLIRSRYLQEPYNILPISRRIINNHELQCCHDCHVIHCSDYLFFLLPIVSAFTEKFISVAEKCGLPLSVFGILSILLDLLRV
jgi:hypothetical protein